MAPIKYDDLFDFPGYVKAIKDAESANKEFGKTVETINARISKQYEEIRTELADYVSVLKSFNVNQKSAGDTIIRTGDSALAAAKKLQEQKRIMNELVGTTDLATRSINELEAGLKGLESEYKKIRGTSDDARAKKQALREEAIRLKKALKEEKDALSATSKVLEAAEGSYQALQAELSSIGKQLKLMPDAFNKTTGQINANNKAAVDLAKRYLEINTVLKAADAQLGNYQRNVGNYASATFSLTQVLRELPSLGVSTQQFFLAISNNLPILFDQFSKLSKTVDETTGKMVGGGGAFKIFAKSIFSLGNLLTIGVTLLTVYGKEITNFIGNLFTGSRRLTEFEKKQKLVNEVFKEASKAVGDDIAKLEVYKTKLNDLSLPAEQRVKVAKEYNKVADETNKIDLKQIDNLELINKKIAAQNALIVQRAVAVAAMSKLTEASNKFVDAQLQVDETLKRIRKTEAEITEEGNRDLRRQIDIRDQQTKSLDNYSGSVEKNSSRVSKAASKEMRAAFALINARNAAKNNLDKLAASLNTLITPEGLTTGGDAAGDKDTQTLADRIKKQQEILKSALEAAIALEELNYEKGLTSEEEFQVKKLQLISKYVDAAKELENQKGKKADIKTITDLQKEKTEAETAYQKFVNDFTDKNRKEDLERAKDTIKSEAELKAQALLDEKEDILSAKKLTDKEKEALELDYQNRVDAIIIDSLERRIGLETDAVKKAELEKQKLELERGINSRNRKFDEAAVEAKYKAEIDAAKKAFDIIRHGRETSFKEELAFLEKLKAIKIKYAKDTAEEEMSIAALKADYERQLREELERTIYMGIQSGLEIAQNLVNGKFEEKLAALDAQKQKELELAGNNAAARAAVEEKFQKKIAEQKNKQAKADRAFALFNVAVNTAQGITKAIAQFGMPFAIPFIALTALQGALQAAVILSRPLPKYKKGRKGGPGEYAIVDEEGPEMIVDSSGRLREMGGSSARVTRLNPGDSVITATDTASRIKNEQLNNIIRETAISNRLSGSIRQGRQDEMIYVMAKALQSGGLNQKEMEAAFEKAVRKIPVQNHIYDERGYRKRIDDVNSKTTYLNNLLRI